MTRMTGPDCAVMCNLIKTHTYTLSIQRESGNGTENIRKKRHLQINQEEKKKETRACGYWGACISKDYD